MKLFKFAKKFWQSEDGAVTVDWVVLTAAVVGLGLIVIGAIEGSVTDLSENIAGSIDAAQN